MAIEFYGYTTKFIHLIDKFRKDNSFISTQVVHFHQNANYKAFTLLLLCK